MMTTWVEEFNGNCLYRLEESERMIGMCLDGLAESDFWHRPNSASNSIGNLLLHLSGNLTQYLVSGLGGAPDKRDRDAEFSTEKSGSKEMIWSNFKKVLDHSKSVISDATAEQLLKSRKVQGFDLSGLGMALHAVEHLSYHTGQIALLVKSMKGEDLGFYRGANLNQHNE